MQSFQDWMKELRKVAISEYGADPANDSLFHDVDWKVYFDDGFSPNEALVSDIQNAQ